MRGDALRIAGFEHEGHGARQLDRLQFRLRFSYSAGISGPAAPARKSRRRSFRREHAVGEILDRKIRRGIDGDEGAKGGIVGVRHEVLQSGNRHSGFALRALPNDGKESPDAESTADSDRTAFPVPSSNPRNRLARWLTSPHAR